MKLFEGRFEVAWYVLVFVVICSYLAFAEGAVAGDTSFQLHTASHHFDSTDRDYNEKNTGMGFTYTKDRSILGYTGGIYKNSRYHTSVYMGGNLKLEDFVSLSLVGITGYKEDVLIAPLISVHFLPNTEVGPVMTIAPTDVGFVTLFSLEWRLGE